MTAQERSDIMEMLDEPNDMTLQEFAEEVNILSASMKGLEECRNGEAIPSSEVIKMMEEKWLKR